MSNNHYISFLDTPVEFLKGVGPQRAEILMKELNITTFGGLLAHFPFRYEDRTAMSKIKDIRSGDKNYQLQGKINSVQEVRQKRGKRLVAHFSDETGTIELVWFKGVQWIKKYVEPGKEFRIYGKPGRFSGKWSIIHPELQDLGNNENTPRSGMHPVYSSTEKLSARGMDSKGLARLLRTLIERLSAADVPESLPGSILSQFKLMPRFQAYQNIHLPESQKHLQAARYRIKFEEFMLQQIPKLQLKYGRARIHNGYVFDTIEGHFKKFYQDHLPFELTGAQKNVLREIRQDVRSGRQMNRLLQGDVGSGKTIVALMSMLMALDNGYQACIMAPTEILANQHLESIHELLKKMGIRVALLTGSVKGATRKEILRLLAFGEIDILIGTHALLEDPVKFKNLGLVVIDEQHRFGVAQRAKLWKKNTHPPHILVMTATPIPRTLAMTSYGDLDYSVIDELPPGRKPILTVHRTDRNRLRLFGFLKEEIKKGRQIYVVYPLIEESATLDYKDLNDGYESMRRAFPSPEFQIGIVHGRQDPKNKDHEMGRFQRNETNILVSTTVIEVGVNVPNASVMVIESAERFGLAQLHQLRGRVGRGADQSYCILMTSDELSNEARRRIGIMCSTQDGFKIAEADMDIRGPGDIMGTRQSGLTGLNLANLSTDQPILQQARDAARKILEDDPDLIKDDNAALSKWLRHNRIKKGEWSRIS